MMVAMSSTRLARLLAASCLLPLLLAACGTPESPPPMPTASADAVPTDQPAPKVLSAAVRKLRKADTGAFTSAIGATRDQGRYALSRESASVSRIITAPEGGETAFTDSVRTPDGVWLRVRTARMNPRRACWVRSSGALGTTTAGIPGAYAGAVGAALTAKGKRWNDEEISGTVDLVQALVAVDPSLAAAPELAPAVGARVPASFTVGDGRLRGWSTTSGQLLGAVAKAGIATDGRLRGLADLDGFVLDVQFSRQGADLAVSAPEPDRVIPAEPADTLLKRGRACMRRK